MMAEFQRRSIRLRGYDYTRLGAYFVTVCTEGRKRLFGTVVNGRMALNDAGRMVQSVWDELPAHYPGVAIDAFVVMPDHIHGVVRLCDPVGAGPRACPVFVGNGDGGGQAQGPAPTPEPEPKPMSLPDVVHRIKTLTTKRYADGVAQGGWPRFPGKLWQRNYYEIIVRDAAALANIRVYIRDNPAHWDIVRYGEPRFMVGNRALLALPKTAFLASRSCGQIQAPGGPAQGPAPTTEAACVISGFLSPLERAVFEACLDSGTPMIQVLARGLPAVFPPRVQRALDAGRLLIMSPFPETEDRLSAPRAAWCNQYLLHVADAVVIGQLDQGGMLACLLADLSGEKRVRVLKGTGQP